MRVTNKQKMVQCIIDEYKNRVRISIIKTKINEPQEKNENDVTSILKAWFRALS